MGRIRRPFYVIGHKANSIDAASDYLQRGVNGLEPDVVHDRGQFYVNHATQQNYDNIVTVAQYLRWLKPLVESGRYNVAIIVWDLKTTDFDINEFVALVRENFYGPVCEQVVMIFTHATDYEFLGRYSGQFKTIGIGVDESNAAPMFLRKYFHGRKINNVSYADGIYTVLNKPQVFKNVTEALQERDILEKDTFGFVYTWVLSRPVAMRKFLGSNVDAIMVDRNAVKRLLRLINNPIYSEAYELAQTGYNPFHAKRIPRYHVRVKTRDRMFAGTSAQFVFTLTGDSGHQLKSLPFNASAKFVFERGKETSFTVEGSDIGSVKEISIERISGGLTASWLPEWFEVINMASGAGTTFSMKDDQWITKRSSPFVLLKA